MILQKYRHKISNNSVYNSLFEGEPSEVKFGDIEHYSVGSELCTGSCLVRGEDSIDIYLVMGYPSTKRYKIENFETFQSYRFKMTSVRHVPTLVLEQVPLGLSITV